MANFEIHIAPFPALADLFQDMKKWRNSPLSVTQIKRERIGLLCWLLLSFSGKTAWKAFTAAVSRRMISPAQQVAKGHSALSPYDIQSLDRELQYLAKILRRNIFYERIGGPLLEIEPEANRTEVDRKAREYSNFASNNVSGNDITLERFLEDAEVALRDLRSTQQVAAPQLPHTGVDHVRRQVQRHTQHKIQSSVATEIEDSASRAIRATSQAEASPSRRELSPISLTENTAPTRGTGMLRHLLLQLVIKRCSRGLPN